MLVRKQSLLFHGLKLKTIPARRTWSHHSVLKTKTIFPDCFFAWLLPMRKSDRSTSWFKKQNNLPCQCEKVIASFGPTKNKNFILKNNQKTFILKTKTTRKWSHHLLLKTKTKQSPLSRKWCVHLVVEICLQTNPPSGHVLPLLRWRCHNMPDFAHLWLMFLIHVFNSDID